MGGRKRYRSEGYTVDDYCAFSTLIVKRAHPLCLNNRWYVSDIACFLLFWSMAIPFVGICHTFGRKYFLEAWISPAGSTMNEEDAQKEATKRTHPTILFVRSSG